METTNVRFVTLALYAVCAAVAGSLFINRNRKRKLLRKGKILQDLCVSTEEFTWFEIKSIGLTAHTYNENCTTHLQKDWFLSGKLRQVLSGFMHCSPTTQL